MITVRILKRPSYPQHGCTSAPGDTLVVTEELAARWVASGIAETAFPAEEAKGFDEPPLNKQMKAAPRKK